MAQYKSIEDYLETVSVEIRYRKIRKELCEELRQHIEDQKEAYIKEGIEEETALWSAIEDMGDPVVVGKQLDQVHRPKIVLPVIGLTLLMTVLGLVVLYAMKEDYDIQGTYQIRYALLGIDVMCICMFFDYTWIVKHAYFWWSTILIIIMIGGEIINLGDVNVISRVSFCMTGLLLPTYAVVMYRLRAKGYRGMCTGIFIGAFGVWILYYCVPGRLLEYFVGYCLLLIFVAVWDWFEVGRKKSIGILLGTVALLITCGTLYFQHTASPYVVSRVQVLTNDIVHNDAEMFDNKMPKEFVENSKWIGESNGTVTFSGENCNYKYIPTVESNFFITYIIARYGKLPAGLFIVLFALLLIISLYYIVKQKNYLGKLLGCACILSLGIQAVYYVCSNLGMTFYNRGAFPFVSYGANVMVGSFFYIGIILSIIRYGSIAKEPRSREKNNYLTNIGKREWIIGACMLLVISIFAYLILKYDEILVTQLFFLFTVAAIIQLVVDLCVYPFIKAKETEKLIWLNIRVLFVLYAIFLFILLIGDRLREMSIYGAESLYMGYKYNLIPFSTISTYIGRGIVNDINFNVIIENLVGNLLLFAPMGFFLPCIFRKLQKVIPFSIVVLLVSIGIEVAQGLLRVGVGDIDDVMLHYLGAILVFAIWKMPIIQKNITKFYNSKLSFCSLRNQHSFSILKDKMKSEE